ncbi:MAG: hypothetical protein E6J58_17095 [Deltaproteobacteria bacterium]|nr:MAG: hypothetical protein E6J58_17095 [Deltaproteobacteria bacterium]
MDAERVLTGVPSAPYTGAVRIVMNGSPPGADYDEVAVVSARGTNGNATLAAVLGALQAEAPRLGCDAVIQVCYEPGGQVSSATGVAVRTRPAW